MTTSEKVAYLKGLFDGLALDPESKESKLFTAIIDVLGDISVDLEDLDETTLELSEEIDEISGDLEEIEDYVFDSEDDDDDEDDDGYSCECCGNEPLFFEVKCPACEDEITIDEDVLELGRIECPNCGETLEFDLSSIDDASDEDEDD